MRSCLSSGQCDGVGVRSRGCLKARWLCNRPQTRLLVAFGGHGALPEGIHGAFFDGRGALDGISIAAGRRRHRRVDWRWCHARVGWNQVSRPSSKRCGGRGRALGQPITAVAASTLASTSQTRCSSESGLPTCASLQPPARSSLCPVPLPCSPHSFRSSLNSAFYPREPHHRSHSFGPLPALHDDATTPHQQQSRPLRGLNRYHIYHAARTQKAQVAAP
jgi:hypothetical protein